MLVRDLLPGMLVQPVKGTYWVLVPWRGHDGKVAGEYMSISTVPHRESETWKTPVGIDPLLYIGPLDPASDGDFHTPGRQLVLYCGQAYSVDPTCWRFLRPTEKTNVKE
jgi:hypothetical protein